MNIAVLVYVTEQMKCPQSTEVVIYNTHLTITLSLRQGCSECSEQLVLMVFTKELQNNMCCQEQSDIYT